MTSVIDELRGFDLANVEAAVGPTFFERGRAYARGRRVLSVGWDPDRHRLTGSVVGHGAIYKTSASFSGADGELVLVDGECSCPIGRRCKHVAALVITASEARRGGRFEPVERAATPTPTATQALPSWEKPLRALLNTPELSSEGAPLAIELALLNSGRAGGETPRLKARLMRPGARGGWVNGSLTWNGLESWQGQNGEYRADQVAVLRGLRAAQRSSEGRMTYYYSAGADKALDLSECSAQFWPLLDEALRLGVTLIHTRESLGEVACNDGELALDVTRGDDGGAVVQAVLRIGDDIIDGVEPVFFLGRDGHGLVCSETAAGRDPRSPQLRLVRLARPAPMRLQKLVLDCERLTIPAGDLERFADEISPALRGIATVISSDDSFEPPEISEPELVLHATYDDVHRVEVAWEWVYTVGATPHRVPLAASGPAFRDRDAERAILAATRIADTGLGRFGLVDDSGRPSAAAVQLTGLDSLLSDDRGAAAAGRDPGRQRRGDRRGGRLPRRRRVARDRRLDTGARRRARLVRPRRHDQHRGARAAVRRGVQGARERRVADAAPGRRPLLAARAPPAVAARADRRRPEPSSDRPSETLRISRYQASLWAELAALGVVSEQAQAWQRQIGALLELDSIAEHALPSTLDAELRPYQREGFGWLATLWSLELGGILADDMGLGKTLQALALVCHARERDPEPRPLPRRRTDERRPGLGQRGRPLHPQPERLRGGRHAHASPGGRSASSRTPTSS